VPLRATLIAVVLVLALALPAAANAQVLDPTVEQYLPSAQVIEKQVKEGGEGGSGGQVEEGAVAGGDGGEVQGGAVAGGDGDGNGGGGQALQGGGGPEVEQGGGPEVEQGGDSVAALAGAPDGGLDDRVVDSLPFTSFDLLVIVLAAAAVTGTAVVLRRLSRPPTVGE
jgi:hypothetical protein